MTPYEGNTADGRHYWLTPPELMQSLQEEFTFDFDPCPYPRPDDFDGLTCDWGKSNYVNPPFKGPTAWVRKAIAENQKGKRVVFVFPIDKWIHLLLEAGATVRNLKDLRWCAIEDGLPGKGTGRHIAAFILEPQRCNPIPQVVIATLTKALLAMIQQDDDPSGRSSQGTYDQAIVALKMAGVAYQRPKWCECASCRGA